jgi:hypothetical protein
MAFQRAFGDSGSVDPEPVGRRMGSEEIRRVTRSTRLAGGTLACPSCDAPVLPLAGAVSPAAELGCPFCHHSGAVRDFLSLVAPARPARVVVRVVQRG